MLKKIWGEKVRNFGILVVSHGKYAIEALNASKMICGDMDGVISLGLLENDSKEQFRKSFTDSYNQLESEYDFVVCLVDIYGGTPFNVVAESILHGKEMVAFTGFNLQVLIELLLSDKLSKEDVCEVVESVYNSSLFNINESLTSGEDEISL